MKNASRLHRHASLPLAATFAFAALTGHAAPPLAVTAIAAHAGHYVVGGRSFDDLNALEAAVREVRPRSLAIVSCEAGAARAWAAAVHRFSDLPLDLHALDASAPACIAPAAMRIVQRADAPSGIDDARVKDYWERVQP